MATTGVVYSALYTGKHAFTSIQKKVNIDFSKIIAGFWLIERLKSTAVFI